MCRSTWKPNPEMSVCKQPYLTCVTHHCFAQRKKYASKFHSTCKTLPDIRRNTQLQWFHLHIHNGSTRWSGPRLCKTFLFGDISLLSHLPICKLWSCIILPLLALFYHHFFVLIVVLSASYEFKTSWKSFYCHILVFILLMWGYVGTGGVEDMPFANTNENLPPFFYSLVFADAVQTSRVTCEWACRAKKLARGFFFFFFYSLWMRKSVVHNICKLWRANLTGWQLH